MLIRICGQAVQFDYFLKLPFLNLGKYFVLSIFSEHCNEEILMEIIYT